MASAQAPFGYTYRSGRTTTKPVRRMPWTEGTRANGFRHQVHKVRTDQTGLSAGEICLHPSMQADWIKPAAGACSLGQDAALKIGDRSLSVRAPAGCLKGRRS